MSHPFDVPADNMHTYTQVEPFREMVCRGRHVDGEVSDIGGAVELKFNALLNQTDCLAAKLGFDPRDDFAEATANRLDIRPIDRQLKARQESLPLFKFEPDLGRPWMSSSRLYSVSTLVRFPSSPT